MITISNEQISATVNLHGAEISSLKKRDTNTEYIWQADPSFWGRHSPILFPIVGRLKDDMYIHNGLTYRLFQHGFARDTAFKLVRQEGSCACLSLKSNNQTLEVYPFKFELLISYELKGNQIGITFEVINQDHQEMFFSIGAHPAFNCPLHQEEIRSDYTLLFPNPETASTQLLENGVRSGSTIPVLHEQRELIIADDLFERDALIFDSLTSRMVTLKKEDLNIVSVHFEGFPYLGIWSRDRDSPFICIEPWQGIADQISHNLQLSEKDGIIKLKAGEVFKCQYRIKLY
ncbi:MAG: aldose 1-epimerase family protein [Cyclobacteriaceae bacterium]